MQKELKKWSTIFKNRGVSEDISEKYIERAQLKLKK